MNMTKSQIKQRLMDIGAGAGMYWSEEEGYWEGLCFEALSRFVEGVSVAFALDKDSHITHYRNLDKYETLDRLTNFIYWYIRSTPVDTGKE